MTTSSLRRPARLPRTINTLLTVLVIATMLPGCVTREREIVHEQPIVKVEHTVVRAMPAVIHEDRGSAPGANFN